MNFERESSTGCTRLVPGWIVDVDFVIKLIESFRRKGDEPSEGIICEIYNDNDGFRRKNYVIFFT